VESVYFLRDGQEFVSCHSDGSYVVWTTDDASRPKDEPKTPYGQYFNWFYFTDNEVVPHDTRCKTKERSKLNSRLVLLHLVVKVAVCYL